MKAVVYSGSRTAFWKISQNGKVIAHCNTIGINPCFIDSKTTLQILNKKSVLVNNAENIKKIYFFAAGVTSAETKNMLINNLSAFFKKSKIFVENDLYGAAKAACNHETGIVSLLGSGSNCAYYDGKKPLKNNFGLGYILGDEGSSNYLGKILLKKLLNKKLPTDLESKFQRLYNLDRTLILEKIYRKPQANVFLSSFIDFYTQNSSHGYIISLVDEAFEKFFQIHILPMVAQYQHQDLYFVGTVAAAFEERLQLAAARHQLTIKTIIKEPIVNLLKHYTN